MPPLDAGLKLIDWWLNAAFDESIMSRQKATFSRSATCGHASWTIPAWIAASVSRRPALHQRSIAAIGGGCVAVSRIGRLGAVDSSKADGGNRSSSVRGPGAPPAAAAGAIVGGSMGDGSNAEDNAADAALIAANAVGGRFATDVDHEESVALFDFHRVRAYLAAARLREAIGS